MSGPLRPGVSGIEQRDTFISRTIRRLVAAKRLLSWVLSKSGGRYLFGVVVLCLLHARRRLKSPLPSRGWAGNRKDNKIIRTLRDGFLEVFIPQRD